jgi:molybdopterin/thiamine biosynthesis adenylyltransferase
VSLLRYERNQSTISDSDQKILKNARVCVIGCGGLGGHIIEMLARLGIGYITAVDGDVFDDTNLNRQLLATSETLGHKKALEAKERVALVNPEVVINSVSTFLTQSNGEAIISGHDLVVDALDHIETRFIVQEICETLGITMIHGAVAGWYGQVATIYPGDRSLDKLYRSRDGVGKEKELGCPAFIPNLISAIEVTEVVKVLLNKGDVLRNKALFINLLEHEYDVIEL